MKKHDVLRVSPSIGDERERGSAVARYVVVENVCARCTTCTTIPDANSGFVIHGTFIEGLDTVTLCGRRRGEVDDYHLQKRITCGKEFMHDDLEQGLALKIVLLLCELDVELLKHGTDYILLVVHDGIE